MVSVSESKFKNSYSVANTFNPSAHSVRHHLFSPKAGSSPKRFSAVEALEASKKDYVKSENVRVVKQMPKNAGILQLGLRRKSMHDESDISVTTHDVCDSGKCLSSTPPPVPPRIKKSNIDSFSNNEVKKASFSEDINISCIEYTPTTPKLNKKNDLYHKHIIDSIGTRSAPTLRKFPKMSVSSKEEFLDQSVIKLREDNDKNNSISDSCIQTNFENEDHFSDGPPHEADINKENNLEMAENILCASVRRRAKKSLHRSKSDVTKRHSNCSDVVDANARLSRGSTDLERFFNEMGIDKNVLEPMIKSHTSQPLSCDFNLCDSLNSLDSPLAISMSSDGVNLNEREVNEPSPGVVKTERTCGSVVERNARIIKWLCNVRKAHSQEDDTPI